MFLPDKASNKTLKLQNTNDQMESNRDELNKIAGYSCLTIFCSIPLFFPLDNILSIDEKISPVPEDRARTSRRPPTCHFGISEWM